MAFRKKQSGDCVKGILSKVKGKFLKGDSKGEFSKLCKRGIQKGEFSKLCKKEIQQKGNV